MSMAKRTFRPQATPSTSTPSYPDHQQFDSGRRDFLWRLGAALLGAGAVSSGILSATGCGDRAVGDDEPPEPPQGVAPAPDSRIDQRVVMRDSAGVGPQPDALIDQPRLPDASGGVAPQPDAGIDGLTPVAPDAGVPLPKDDK
jgi:hypothetical protein